ncbi:MAG: sigma 54-interacting transcriptional regulator [Thermodesulfobacteriota bacterium]
MRKDLVERPSGLVLESFHGIFSRAPEMQPLFQRIRQVARTSSTVLIRGESGSGKELVARAIHALSPRSRGPFRAISCAALSPMLLESELFGHVRGAFTGAVRDHRGIFEQADGGTLFLDEVAEVPLDVQTKLLRVLEDRTIVPVGGSKPITVDVRLISATHKALRREVAAGRFRNDLRYRIRVVPLFLPPLRQRTGDVEGLLWHFVDHFNEQGMGPIGAVTRQALEALLAYSWPGNVRELRNVVEHAFAVDDDGVMGLEDLTPELRNEPPPDEAFASPSPLEESERERLVRAMLKHKGKRAPVAAELGISRTTLWHKLHKHHLV